MTEEISTYPVLPLRDIVVFPHMIVPLFVGREKSINALEDVMQEDKQVFLATQKNAGVDDPNFDDVFQIGTIGTILQLLKLPDGTVKVLVEGTHRAKIKKYLDNDKFFEAEAEKVEESNEDSQERRGACSRYVRGYRPFSRPRCALGDWTGEGLGPGFGFKPHFALD